MVYLVTILVTSIFAVRTVSSSPWNDPTSNQFHIQTDEGPERYFKYQTQNGQYRKEKRLEDGTVIGSYAWIDDNGYLRQRDYIADSQGYRIVKNKNVYVGRNVNVGDAVKATKKITNSYIPPTNYNIPSSVPNRGYVAVTPRPILRASTVSPSVEISLNSIPSSTPSSVVFDSSSFSSQSYSHDTSTTEHFQTSTSRPITSTISSTLQTVSTPTSISPSTSYLPSVPSSSFQYPSSSPYSPSSTQPPVFYSPTPENELSPPLPEYNTPRTPTYIPPENSPSSTPSPNPASVYLPTYIPSSTPSTIYIPSSTPGYIKITPPPRNYIPQSSINTNSIEYSSNPQYEHYPDEFVNPYIHQNGPTYPIDTRGQSFNPTYNKIGNGYDPQYPYYDGISVTNDGFRYYIPKAYHEEQNVGSDTKSGSFGYIDPFGIRRVIYYNAGPNGFKHRKNNRYVGHDATPYDPRPF
ncbi:DNA-directed RNA polymerase II subunit RPB1 [Coccinella septempunctata]|uniref:DNA-directed RNA polymerase II subunit RPB1 n=1 Tax=Coccinella septempunctata TaxID=41139 RepID=UPI001D06E116|nr:DNA-directed RNA polymerase II subunit RPB1 [Coccinella septempunctata]